MLTKTNVNMIKTMCAVKVQQEEAYTVVKNAGAMYVNTLMWQALHDPEKVDAASSQNMLAVISSKVNDGAYNSTLAYAVAWSIQVAGDEELRHLPAADRIDEKLEKALESFQDLMRISSN